MESKSESKRINRDPYQGPIGYKALPYDPKGTRGEAIKSRNEYYSRILVAVFATMNIMWIAIAQYAGYFMGMERGHKNILNIAEFVLATPTLFSSVVGYFFVELGSV